MFILKKQAIDFLNQYFKLPARGDEQDWDVELANPDRVEEFLDGYDDDFSNDIKLALMALIFASYDEYIVKYKKDVAIEARIKKILDKKRDLFLGLLRYWAVENKKDPKKCFNLTVFARSVLSK